MPLVDYESSDEGSDNDNDVDEKREEAQLNEKESKPAAENVMPENNSGEDNATLFSSLPKPRKNFSFLGDNKLTKLLLNKNENLPLGKKPGGESIKISVPSISEFEDDGEQPAAKKLKPSANGVGLFSVLPPPKHNAVKETNRTLVPHAVAKNQKRSTLGSEINSSNLKSSAFVKEIDLEEPDDDTVVGTSFFGSSLSQPNVSAESQGTSTEYTSFDNTQTAANSIGTTFAGDQNTSEQNDSCSSTPNEDSYNYNYDCSLDSIPLPETPAENNPLELDEKALQILCGGKKKRQQMPMNIIDLSGEEIMPDSKEWLLKQFTEEKTVRSHGHKKGHGPSSLQRRKHQITYLAYQAKEMELELQNQWAQNRMSRKQTQSKYGF